MSLYYCDPMRSGQKGGIEEVHTLLRMIIPKRTIFTHLTQWDINKCVNHINSYPKTKLDGMTPYQLSLEKFGPDILRALHIKCIAPDTFLFFIPTFQQTLRMYLLPCMLQEQNLVIPHDSIHKLMVSLYFFYNLNINNLL